MVGEVMVIGGEAMAGITRTTLTIITRIIIRTIPRTITRILTRTTIRTRIAMVTGRTEATAIISNTS